MAAPQPDFTILSESLIAAGQQIERLPNLPAINHEQYLRDQFAALRQGMDEQFRLLRVELDTRFEHLRVELDARFEQVNTRFDTRFEQVDTRFEQFNTRFANLELSSRAEARNQAARLFNSHVTSVETQLHALYNQQNEAIEGFPENLAALARLHDNAITALLNAYDLATDGTVAMKRRRFRYFIGAVINA
ncbi:MAG: hypothetical protein M1836_002519 [Candelina mexicana]|nr:MAG: hypothetical protein M1836_002519 [Candelina mexicana]